MAGLYLTDLAAVCRAAGLTVYEQDGWQFRARSSGGYDTGRPTHVMVHHTASGPGSDGWPDADYCSFVSDIRPVANLYLDRQGAVYVLAAGATNTNGAGVDPCGDVPDDSMNTHAIGIEAGNDGVGEPWPDVQQDAYVVLVAALDAAYSIPPERVHSHAEWTPDGRKIDPAGPSRFGSSTWNMDLFRDELNSSTPTPPIPGDDMAALGYYRDDRPDVDEGQGTWQIWLVSGDQVGNVWTCPIPDLPDRGKWELVQPIVGDPPVRPFAALVALMDVQNRPG
jgi:hypothetical protein